MPYRISPPRRRDDPEATSSLRPRRVTSRAQRQSVTVDRVGQRYVRRLCAGKVADGAQCVRLAKRWLTATEERKRFAHLRLIVNLANR